MRRDLLPKPERRRRCGTVHNTLRIVVFGGEQIFDELSVAASRAHDVVAADSCRPHPPLLSGPHRRGHPREREQDTPGIVPSAGQHCNLVCAGNSPKPETVLRIDSALRGRDLAWVVGRA